MLVRPIWLHLVRHGPSRPQVPSGYGYVALRLVALHPQTTFRQYISVRSSTDLAAPQTSVARAYPGELRGVFARKSHTSIWRKEKTAEQRNAAQTGVDSISNKSTTAETRPRDAGYGWTIVAQQEWLKSFERQALELMPTPLLSLYDDPLLVVLGSPRVAGEINQLNDVVFQILAKVNRPASGSTLQLHVLSAIVDKVSVPANAKGVIPVDDPFSGADGFSFWWTSHRSLRYQQQDISQDKSQARGSLTVHINEKAHGSNVEDVRISSFGIPLANTTFVTGIDYTMSLTRMTWNNVQRRENGAWSFADRNLDNIQQLHKQNVVLTINNHHRELLPQTHFNVAPSELTPWRPVQEVSGNVVKALRGPDGRLPASAELETAITQIAPASYGGFEVWAEIQSADKQAQGQDDTIFPRYAKVVGGGGGWGDKRGLIALDAEPAVELPSKAEQGFPEELDLGNMLPNVVEPGDQLRFMSFPSAKPDTAEPSKTEGSISAPSQIFIQEDNQTRFGFGTTGNPEHDIEEDIPSQSDSASSNQSIPPSYTVFGHFGAMSQRMFYEHAGGSKDQPVKQHATNLPPYTYFANSGKFVPISKAPSENHKGSEPNSKFTVSSKT